VGSVVGSVWVAWRAGAGVVVPVCFVGVGCAVLCCGRFASLSVRNDGGLKGGVDGGQLGRLCLYLPACVVLLWLCLLLCVKRYE